MSETRKPSETRMPEPSDLATSNLATSDPVVTERLYHALRLTRVVEDEVARVYPTDVIKSPVHLSIGQEFVSVGVCDALEPRDHVSITYRGHAAYIAKGGDLRAMVAEMYGKKTGSAQGRGGSMHLVDLQAGVIGASAVVGTSIPVAAGFALAAKRKRTGGVVACFFGDGATEEGCFAESLNFAALHKLPVLFICENNGYAIHEPQSKRWATDRLCERVATYGIPARRIADGNVFTVRDAAVEAVAAMRDGGGPAFLEVMCYRWREHVGPNEDFNQGYRPASEMAPWAERDEVGRLAALLPPERVAAIEESVVTTVNDAFAFAENSPFPVPEDLYDHVYA